MRFLTFSVSLILLAGCIGSPPSEVGEDKTADAADRLDTTPDVDVGVDAVPDSSDVREARDIGTDSEVGPDAIDGVDSGDDMSTRPGIHLQIPAGSVDSDLSGFVALVDGRHDLMRNTAPDASHLRFVDPEGTRLPHEVESYDPDTGSLRAWVRLELVPSDEPTDFWLEVGAEPFEPANASDTWSDDWAGVWHMEEDNHDEGATIVDSSPFGNDGTTEGTTDAPAQGKIGTAISMDGYNDFVWMDRADSVEPSTALTLSAWVRPNREDQGSIISKPATSITENDNNSFNLFVDFEQRLAGKISTEGTPLLTRGSQVEVGEWQFVVMTYDGEELAVYRNTTLVNSATVSGAIDYDDHSLFIGVDVNGGYYELILDALIDEVRLSRRAAGPARISAWYANQSDPAGFILWDP